MLLDEYLHRNFHCGPGADNSTILTTETRRLCLGAVTRRKFQLYWTVVGPFSGLVRRKMLRPIKRAAERAFQTAQERSSAA